MTHRGFVGGYVRDYFLAGRIKGQIMLENNSFFRHDVGKSVYSCSEPTHLEIFLHTAGQSLHEVGVNVERSVGGGA